MHPSVIAPAGAPALSPDEIAALVAATAPKPVPAEYADRVVSIVGPHPLDYRARRFRKEYRLKVGCDGSMPSHWMDETDPSASAHSLGECWLDDLSDFVELLSNLARQSALTIALGRLKDDSRNPDMSDGQCWLIPDRRGRYEDEPTPWLPIDIDHLDCDDPLDAADAIDDFIARHMPELDGCGYVWTHTGSSGVKGTRVRLWLELEQPRHLAAMAAYARLVNEHAGRAVIDATIYQPGRLLFTAAPLLLAADGKPWRRPVLSGVWHVASDMVPADAFPDVLPGAAVYCSASKPPREMLTKTDTSALLGAMGPGNYNKNAHDYLCSEAWRAAEHRERAAFEAALANIRARICATSDAEHLAARLRKHADPARSRRVWEAARERCHRQLATAAALPSIVEKLLPSLGSISVDTTNAGLVEDAPEDETESFWLDDDAPLSVGEARTRLRADFKRIADDVLLKRAKGHWLLTQPPGLGKSKLLEMLATPGSLSSNLVRIRVPTHQLAEQLVADLQRAAAAHNANPAVYGDLPPKIRHHKGRGQPDMCPDDESRPKADRVEALGVSPKKAVCPNCKTGQAGLCPWLNQDKDDGAGIIVETHASAVSIARERRSDLNIIDENIIGSLVEAEPEAIDLDSLAASQGAIRKPPNALGTLVLLAAETRRLGDYRKDLLKALRAAVPAIEGEPGVLPVNTLTDFAGPATFKAREGFNKIVERTGAAIDEAMELESQLQDSLVQQILKTEDAGKDSGELRAQLRVSRIAAKLYEAIAASMKCSGEYVFGIALFWETRNGKRRDFLKLATRAADLAHVFGDASVTMDGTANESVWRACVSPSGAPFDGEVIGAAVAVPDGSLHAVQYADRPGSRSSLTPRSVPSERERANVERRDTLKGAARWARNAIGADDFDRDLAAASTAVDVDAFNREQQRLRADARLALIYRFACFKAAEAATRAVEIEGRPVSVLLVAQKVISEQLAAMGLPRNVAVEHFGKLRGLNAYKHVPVAIIVGRVRPANIDLELITEALHMHNPAVKTIGRYHPNTAEGRPWLEVHPDPLVATVQSQITEAGVRQAVARVRPYDRSAERPVEVHVFGQCETGLPADRVQRRLWCDAGRSPVEIAAARGCVFLDQRLNYRAYGPLFPKGNKRGCGKSDLEGAAKWHELVANLARNGTGQATPSVDRECTPYPNSEVRDQTPNSLLGIESTFDLPPGVTFTGDALDFGADTPAAGFAACRQHRLVKLSTPGSRKGKYAIVGVTWTALDIEQLLCAPVDKMIEQSADDVHALVARRVADVTDTR